MMNFPMRYDKNNFIKKSKSKHNNKYSYDLVHNFKNVRDHVLLICPIHGTFKQQVRNHLEGKGCPKCRYANLTRTSKDDFLKKVIKIHGTKYTYNNLEEFVNYKNFIEINCPYHGTFFQKVRYHLEGCGCPKCKDSKGEKKIRIFLDERNLFYFEQQTFSDCISPVGSLLKFDFYLPQYNLCIEFDGEQHFSPVFGEEAFEGTKERDLIKNNYCSERSINLLRIPYWDIKNIDSIVENSIMSLFSKKFLTIFG